MKIKIIVAIGILLLLWCSYSSRIVSVEAGEIVSSEKVKIDSATTEIKMVTPDEIQRLEDKRGDDIKRLRSELSQLRIRVSKLEEQINQ